MKKDKQGREWCPYCQSFEHRSTAWTANGSDLERFERIHRAPSK